MTLFRGLCGFVFLLIGLSPQAAWAQRDALLDSLQKTEESRWQDALRIWKFAEPGYQEIKSAALLAETLEQAGFTITRGVAGIPTAFTAQYGAGEPVIGMLGEYDALPGLSQKAVPVREPALAGAYGHACGHHLFGVASVAASIALAEQIKAGKIKGAIRFYGCPAEEGGAAKVFMVRDGLFKDCAAVFHWHPGNRNAAGDRSSMARIAAKFRFHGKAAHAASAPEQGRSALDAVELTNHAAELLREHTPDMTRIHHVITAGGEAPNVVPDFAEVYFYVRHPQSSVARDVYRRLELCARAGALATETKLEIEYYGGTVEVLPNHALTEVVLKNLRAVNDLTFTAAEQEFSMRIQQTLDEPRPLESIREVADLSGQTGKGSTDVADVSWNVPTVGFTTVCWVPGTPAHSWQAVAAGGTSIGRKGLHLAARVLAVSALEVFQNPGIISDARAELQSRLAAQKYESFMQPGQKPPLDYRNPGKRKVVD